MKKGVLEWGIPVLLLIYLFNVIRAGNFNLEFLQSVPCWSGLFIHLILGTIVGYLYGSWLYTRKSRRKNNR